MDTVAGHLEAREWGLGRGGGGVYGGWDQVEAAPRGSGAGRGAALRPASATAEGGPKVPGRRAPAFDPLHPTASPPPPHHQHPPTVPHPHPLQSIRGEVEVPRSVPGLVTPRLLVMGFVEGEQITRLKVGGKERDLGVFGGGGGREAWAWGVVRGGWAGGGDGPWGFGSGGGRADGSAPPVRHAAVPRRASRPHTLPPPLFTAPVKGGPHVQAAAHGGGPPNPFTRRACVRRHDPGRGPLPGRLPPRQHPGAAGG